MKTMCGFLFASVTLSALYGCVQNSGADTLPAESQYVELNSEQYTDNGLTTIKQSKIITSQSEYNAELTTYSSNTAETVDFTNGKVLLLDMGIRSTGGYSIGVTSVDVSENSLVVNIRLVKPGQDCVVSTALTNPYQFVYIPTLKEILVSETMEIDNC